jgi:hypothetical protein
MKRRMYVSVAMVLAVFVLASCADMQTKWNAMTPDQKARVVTSGMQTQLSNLFDSGKAFVSANPAQQATWKGTVIPAFDAANKSLAGAQKMLQAGTLTPDAVYAQVQPLINVVINALTQMGVIIPK